MKAGWSTGGNDIYPGNAVITQVQTIRTTNGKSYPASDVPFESTVEKCPLVDAFQQMEYTSPFTGQKLPYNLYLPENYNPENSYPLVLFIHDAGAVSNEVKQTLVQGRGAVAWTTPESQAKYPCIVVSPQAMPIGWYVNGNMSDPKVQTGPIEDVLIKDLIPYIDKNYRTIATGKGRGLEGFSMGGCGTLRLAFKYPDLFCAASSVAGALVNWEEEHMTRALECTFGDVNNPASKAYFDSLHPRVFATRNASVIKKNNLKVRMFVGTADKLYNDNGALITTRFHQLLDDLKIPHTYEIVPDANHSPQQLFAPGKLKYDVIFWNKAFE